MKQISDTTSHRSVCTPSRRRLKCNRSSKTVRCLLLDYMKILTQIKGLNLPFTIRLNNPLPPQQVYQVSVNRSTIQPPPPAQTKGKEQVQSPQPIVQTIKVG